MAEREAYYIFLNSVFSHTAQELLSGLNHNDSSHLVEVVSVAALLFDRNTNIVVCHEY